MDSRLLPLPISLVIAIAIVGAADIPRGPDGRPDLSGTYDVATLTPLQRPEKFGDTLTLTDEEAAAVATNEAERLAGRNAASDPNREPPPEGGDGSGGGKGNVGGYDAFWKGTRQRGDQGRGQVAHVDHHGPNQRSSPAADPRSREACRRARQDVSAEHGRGLVGQRGA